MVDRPFSQKVLNACIFGSSKTAIFCVGASLFKSFRVIKNSYRQFEPRILLFRGHSTSDILEIEFNSNNKPKRDHLSRLKKRNFTKNCDLEVP